MSVAPLETAPESPRILELAALILDSHERVVGKSLLSVGGGLLERARALFTAPCVVLAHGTGHDPCFEYGNQQALRCSS